jgi:hypothetical protein
VTIEVDLARNPRGELIGTLGNPAEGEKGLPLTKVVVGGRGTNHGFPATGGHRIQRVGRARAGREGRRGVVPVVDAQDREKQRNQQRPDKQADRPERHETFDQCCSTWVPGVGAVRRRRLCRPQRSKDLAAMRFCVRDRR